MLHNDAFRLIREPRDAALFVVCLFGLVALIPEILRVLV